MAKEFPSEGFEVTKKEEVYRGQNSEVDAVVVSSGEFSVDLLRKKVTSPYSPDFEEGHQWHTYLEKNGYPVLPTFRYDSEKKIEYITDLRRGGTHKVIDFCNYHNDSEKTYVSNFEELEVQVKELLEKSANDGLIINEPNIFFDIEISTGIAKIIMGDLRELGYERFYEGPYLSREQVLEHNQIILKGHVERLRAIASNHS